MNDHAEGPDVARQNRGRVVWIGIRPRKGADMRVVSEADLSTSDGVVGDYFGGDTHSPRQVTLVQFEALAEIAAVLNLREVSPSATRRNIAVSGVDLFDLIGHEFTIGEAVLLATGDCPPCTRMDETLGAGGRDAMIGRAGITARVIQPGTVQVGDTVVLNTKTRASGEE